MDFGESIRLKTFDQLSIVIPAFNEAQNLEELIRQIHAVSKSQVVKDYEILIVDDGSTDGSADLLSRLQQADEKLVVITLRANFGKSAALMAGFDHAKGDVIVTMDGDLQDDPKEIPRLLSELQKGYDLVSGWKQHRQDSFEKRIASRVFNFFVSWLTHVQLQDFNCGFKAYRAWCLKGIRLTGNLYRFLPVFVARQGGKIVELPVVHHKRAFGKSKYGFKRYLEGGTDLCTVLLLSKFFQKPLYFFAVIGVPIMFLGSGLGLYLLGAHIYYLFTGDLHYQLINRPLLQVSVTLFAVGLQVFLFGLLAELIVSRDTSATNYKVKSVHSKERSVSTRSTRETQTTS